MPPLPTFRTTRKVRERTVPGARSWLMRARPTSERASQPPGQSAAGRRIVVVGRRDPDPHTDGREQPAGPIEHVGDGVEPLHLVRTGGADAGHAGARAAGGPGVV